MTTATEPTSLVDHVPTDLADLSRDGGGYHVRLIFLPDIATPEEACVSILSADGSPLDSFTVPFDDYRDAYDHPAARSAKLRDLLAPKQAPASE